MASLYSSLSMANLAMAVGIVSFYVLSMAIYRLYFHPLARFPGPRIAAVSLLYEFYYDVIQGGQYTYKIRELHKIYGPILRISPWEIHIDDPEFWDQVYTSANNPREKWSWTADAFGLPTSFFSSVKVDIHRARRAPLSPFFSRRAVTDLTPVITTHIDKLCARLEEYKASGEPASLKYAYCALSLDVVTDYAFAKAYNSLDQPGFMPQWAISIEGLVEASYLAIYFPIIPYIMNSLPPALVKRIAPQMALTIDFQQGIREQIIVIMSANPKEHEERNRAGGHKTIFHELLHNNTLPLADRTVRHLRDEGQLVVAAGQLTTANHLQTTTYRVLTDPAMLAKLRAELKTVMPYKDSPIPSLDRLENLPYLSAVILEGHRISYGVVHRSQRVSPKEPIIYGKYAIPPGTPVGMSTLIQHNNTDLFPDPEKFDPERFIKDPALKKYLTHFSRGTRNCLGQNLANAELYLTLAAILHRFEFEIVDTTPRDVDFVRDLIVPMPAKGARGLTVLVKP